MPHYQPTEEEIEGIELREDSVQDLMSRPPSYLLRWGTVMVFWIIAVLFGISWFVKYPDIIRGEILISGEQAPVDVVTKVSGNLIKILVKDGDTVKLGQQLAVLHSVADADEIFKLQSDLKSIENLQPDSILLIKWPFNRPLGELQNNYADFIRHLDDYRLFLEKQTDLQQVPFLLNEIDYYQRLNEQLSLKDSILLQEVQLAEIKVKRMKEAKSFGGVSADEVESSESSLLQQRRIRRDMNLQKIEYQIKINDLSKQIQNIRQRTQETAQSRYLMLKDFYQRLSAAVDTWIISYVLIAPVDGEIAFQDLWSERQYVQVNTALMTVIPLGNNLIGRISLPVQGSGKVEIGQRVNVALQAYPRQEYGTVDGVVKKISLLPKDNKLRIELSLPKGLETSYKKKLSYRPNMSGQADIITKPRRLLQRLIDLILGFNRN
jgi:multidrug resistance efflux pump